MQGHPDLSGPAAAGRRPRPGTTTHTKHDLSSTAQTLAGPWRPRSLTLKTEPAASQCNIARGPRDQGEGGRDGAAAGPRALVALAAWTEQAGLWTQRQLSETEAKDCWLQRPPQLQPAGGAENRPLPHLGGLPARLAVDAGPLPRVEFSRRPHRGHAWRGEGG